MTSCQMSAGSYKNAVHSYHTHKRTFSYPNQHHFPSNNISILQRCVNQSQNLFTFSSIIPLQTHTTTHIQEPHIYNLLINCNQYNHNHSIKYSYTYIYIYIKYNLRMLIHSCTSPSFFFYHTFHFSQIQPLTQNPPIHLHIVALFCYV